MISVHCGQKASYYVAWEGHEVQFWGFVDWPILNPNLVLAAVDQSVSNNNHTVVVVESDPKMTRDMGRAKSEIATAESRGVWVAMARVRALEVVWLWPETWRKKLDIKKYSKTAEDKSRLYAVANRYLKGIQDDKVRYGVSRAAAVGLAWTMMGGEIPHKGGFGKRRL